MSGRWNDANAKERSEIVKNFVSAAAVIVGGFWVLYQWDTLFPKTSAEVTRAAAGVRSALSGALEISMGREGEPTSFDDVCSKGSEAAHLQMPLVGRLVLESASGAPVLVRLGDLEVSRYQLGWNTVEAGAPEGPATPVAPITIRAPLPADSVLGGLHWSRIEQGQSIALSFALRVNLPFPCWLSVADHGTHPIFAIGVGTQVQAIDPRNGAPIEDSTVRKVFLRSCQVSPNGETNCNLEQLVGAGQ